MTAPAKAGYLPHIDGLRAVAVMVVLLFHFSMPGFEGGFVGVDVFFVISGYLISSILVGELTQTGRLHFRRFYARRVRRILPALLATILATTVLAVAALPPEALVAYGKSAAASAVSLANVLFWSESGYFDASSQTKPLLHTWSLSVEEQFYLVWPAFLYLLYRLSGKRGLAWGIVLAGLASYLGNHLVVAGGAVGYKSDIFFLPHWRVFEFAIGGTGWFLLRRVPASRALHEGLMALGLGLIAYSVVTTKEGDVFPYVKALAPCIGAFLVIAARNATAIGALLTNQVAVWLGRISYSLYLVHWPIVIFTLQYLPGAAWTVQFAVMALLSLVAAAALHHGIEARYRYATGTAPGAAVRNILLVALSCVVIGVALWRSDGLTWRYRYFTPGVAGHVADGAQQDVAGTNNSPQFVPLGAAQIEAGKSRRFSGLAHACTIMTLEDPSRCFMSRKLQVLVFGNSHEPDAFNAFQHLYGDSDQVNLISFGTVNDCAITLGANSVASPTRELECDKRFARLSRSEFLRNLDVLVYNTHQGFDYVARDLWSVMEILKRRKPSLRIIAIGSYLQTKTDCSSLYNLHKTLAACRDATSVNYFNVEEKDKSAIPQVATLDYLYISKYQLLCGNGELSACVVEANGEPAFYDKHHLSLGMANLLGDRIAATYAAQLKQYGFPDVAKPTVHSSAD